MPSGVQVMVVGFDTHAVVKELVAAGFTGEQAEAVTRAVRQAQDIDLSNLATKTDLAELKAELKGDLSALKSDLTAVKSDLTAAKSDIASVRSELKSDMAVTKSDIRRDIADTKADILKWMVGTIGIQTVVIIGAVLALARLGLH